MPLKNIAITFILLINACSTKNKNNFADFVSPKIVFDLTNKFTFEPSLSSLCILNSFNEYGSSFYALIDYPAGVIYLYDKKRQCFVKEFKVPKTTKIADVLYVFGSDSIVYLDNTSHRLVICDTMREKKKLSSSDMPHPHAHFTRIQNKLEMLGGYLVLDVLIDYNSITQPHYYELASNVPCLGLFKPISDTLYYQQIPIFNPTKQTVNKKTISNFLIFVTDPKTNQIIYTTRNNCDTIYSYNLISKYIQKSVVRNSSYPIRPLFYNEDTINGSKDLAFNLLANRHNTCSRFILDTSTNLFYRMLTIRDDVKQKRYLQVLDFQFKVKLEVEIPAHYDDIRYIDGEVLVHRIDRKARKSIYEKFSYHN